MPLQDVMPLLGSFYLFVDGMKRDFLINLFTAKELSIFYAQIHSLSEILDCSCQCPFMNN